MELAGEGQALDHPARHVERLNALTHAEVSAAARRYLDRSRAVAVVLGDADHLQPHLAGVDVTRL